MSSSKIDDDDDVGEEKSAGRGGGGKDADEDEAAGSSLVDRVCEYCMSHGFDADFETYMTENAAVFLDAVDAAAGSEAIEHKLEYQECFDRFLAIFEGRLSAVLEQFGGSPVAFRDECVRVMSGPDEFTPRRFFVEKLLATMEYRYFFSMMVGEARILASKSHK